MTRTGRWPEPSLGTGTSFAATRPMVGMTTIAVSCDRIAAAIVPQSTGRRGEMHQAASERCDSYRRESTLNA